MDRENTRYSEGQETILYDIDMLPKPIGCVTQRVNAKVNTKL